MKSKEISKIRDLFIRRDDAYDLEVSGYTDRWVLDISNHFNQIIKRRTL